MYVGAELCPPTPYYLHVGILCLALLANAILLYLRVCFIWIWIDLTVYVRVYHKVMKLCHMSHIFAFSAIKCIGHYMLAVYGRCRWLIRTWTGSEAKRRIVVQRSECIPQRSTVSHDSGASPTGTCRTKYTHALVRAGGHSCASEVVRGFPLPSSDTDTHVEGAKALPPGNHLARNRRRWAKRPLLRLCSHLTWNSYDWGIERPALCSLQAH